MAIRFVFGLLIAASLNAQTVDFERQVHPILAVKCLSCHSEEKRSGAKTGGKIEL